MASGSCSIDCGRTQIIAGEGHGRPIGAILLAFHAFANVVLFYQSCLESGLKDEGYCEANMDRHLPELELMANHLRATTSLTEAGQLLRRPLAGRVAVIRH